MIYNDFLLIYKISEETDAKDSPIDIEAFASYLKQIDEYLDSYFEKYYKQQTYTILKERAKGKALQEIGRDFNLSRERIRQIIASTIKKFKNPRSVEMRHELYNLFYLLCEIGTGELRSFFDYLASKKHVLVLIIDDILYKQSLKNIKPSIKKERAIISFAPDNEIKDYIVKTLKTNKSKCGSIIDIANIIESDYRKNRNLFSGKITWLKIIDIAYDMLNKKEIIKVNSKYIVVKQFENI